MKINHKLDKNINCLWPAHTPTSQYRNVFNQYFKNKIKKKLQLQKIKGQVYYS